MLHCSVADVSLDEANKELVHFLVQNEVARHVTAMYTLERIAASDWARTRTLMASINEVHTLPHAVRYDFTRCLAASAVSVCCYTCPSGPRPR